jgi:hypothetical protein
VITLGDAPTLVRGKAFALLGGLRQHHSMYRTSRTLPQPPGKGANRLLAKCWLACAIAVCLHSGIANAAEDSLQGPDVTIIAQEEKTIYEYRQGGQLRMVKVVPAWGKPYYLVPRDPIDNFGDLERAETLFPSWVIFEF